MKKINEKSIQHPKTIMEAIGDLQEFFESDMWFASTEEWKSEKDMLEYLRGHFKILREEISEIQTSRK